MISWTVAELLDWWTWVLNVPKSTVEIGPPTVNGEVEGGCLLGNSVELVVVLCEVATLIVLLELPLESLWAECFPIYWLSNAKLMPFRDSLWHLSFTQFVPDYGWVLEVLMLQRWTKVVPVKHLVRVNWQKCWQLLVAIVLCLEVLRYQTCLVLFLVEKSWVLQLKTKDELSRVLVNALAPSNDVVLWWEVPRVGLTTDANLRVVIESFRLQAARMESCHFLKPLRWSYLNIGLVGKLWVLILHSYWVELECMSLFLVVPYRIHWSKLSK